MLAGRFLETPNAHTLFRAGTEKNTAKQKHSSTKLGRLDPEGFWGPAINTALASICSESWSNLPGLWRTIEDSHGNEHRSVLGDVPAQGFVIKGGFRAVGSSFFTGLS